MIFNNNIAGKLMVMVATKTIDGHRIVVRDKGKRYGLNGIKLY